MISEAVAPAETRPEGEEPRPTRLFNRNFLLLWQGQAVSRMGDQVFTVALAFWIKEVTGSATLMGLVIALSALPALLLEPIGGAVADRYSRKAIIVWSDLLSGVLVLSLAAAVYFIPNHQATIVWVFIVSTLMATLNAFFIPAIAASVPDLVPHERLAGANSMGQLSAQFALFLGQGLGGLLVRLLGAPALFLLNGLSFVFASMSTSFVRIPQQRTTPAANWRALFVAFRDDIAAGLRYVWRAPGLREFLLISTTIGFFNTPILMLLPFYVQDTLRVTTDWYGYIAAAYGLGTLLGYIGLVGLRLSGRARGIGIMLCFIIGPIGTMVLGTLTNPFAAVALAFLDGISSGYVAVNITTILQLTTPNEMRGRIFGLLGTLGGAVAPIAAALSGVVADALDQNIRLIYIASGLIMLAIALLGLFSRSYRSFVSYEEPAT